PPLFSANATPAQMLAATGIKLDETSETITVTLQLPRFAEQNIKINAEGTTLRITAEQRAQHQEGFGKRGLSETSVNRFEQTISLPCAVDPDGLSKTFDNGTLRVTLRKKA